MAKKGKQGDGGGRPPKFTSVTELSDLIDDYFKEEAYMGEGDSKMFAPTMSGLAYKLDMCRKTLLNYSNNDKFLHTIKRARERVHQALEQRLYGNNVAGIIFNLKNNFDWKDQTVIENNMNVTLKEVDQMSDDELKKELDGY